MPCPESYQRRRRAGASSGSQSSIRPTPGAREGLGLLADDDHVRLPDHRRQPPQRVQEGAQVRRLHVVRERVQAGAHRRVRGLEHAQQRLTRRAQQRRVGAVVQLDLVRRLAQRGAGRRGGRDAQAWDCHGLTLAHDLRVGWQASPDGPGAQRVAAPRSPRSRAGAARAERGRAAQARRRRWCSTRTTDGVYRARAARDARASARSAAAAPGAWPDSTTSWWPRVLLDRRPSWLASWAAWVLRADVLRACGRSCADLVRAGAIERPELRLYLDGLLATSRAVRVGRAQALRSDPDCSSADLWDLLALGGGRNDSLTAADAADAGWGGRRCWRGVVPRERVLDALLDALAGDLVAYRTSWYTKLWRALARDATTSAPRGWTRWPRCSAPRPRRWSASRSRSSGSSSRCRRTWTSGRRWPRRRRRPSAPRCGCSTAPAARPWPRRSRSATPAPTSRARRSTGSSAGGWTTRRARRCAARWTCWRRRNGRARRRCWATARRGAARRARRAADDGAARARRRRTATTSTRGSPRCRTRSGSR